MIQNVKRNDQGWLMDIYYSNQYQLWIMRVWAGKASAEEYAAPTMEKLKALYARSKGVSK